MNEDIKQRWLMRLRDPRAKQCRGHLAVESPEAPWGVAACALGWLCLLGADEGVVRVKPRLLGFLGFEDLETHEIETRSVPYAVLEWAGLTRLHAVEIERRNDMSKCTLPELADYIEREL
jgi:hypothetical protein